VLEETRVLAIDPSSDPVIVDTDRGRLLAERVVVTAGAWVSELVPAMRGAVVVSRQHVGYFDVGPAGALGRFPLWVYLGDPARGLYYGLPEFGRPGIKAALHGVSAGGDDPEAHPGPDARAVERAREFLSEQLSIPVGEVLHAETCLYTNTPDERFVIGPLPGHPNVVVGSICSGHGFKFGPLMGRLLGGLAMNGSTGVPEFERHRDAFAWRRGPVSLQAIPTGSGRAWNCSRVATHVSRGSIVRAFTSRRQSKGAKAASSVSPPFLRPRRAP
jgi:sarcosine oxidase